MAEELVPVKSDKIKVAYLVRPAEGGIKSHVLTLMNGLDRTRFEPVLICPPDSSLYEEAREAGHRVIPLDLVGEISPAKDMLTAFRLRWILLRLRPDVLHIHSAKAGFVGRLAVIPKLRRPRVILTVHSFVFDERVKRLKRMITGWIERRLLRYTDRIVAVSNALKDELVSQMRLDPAKIQVIYNGVVFRDVPKPEHTGIRVGTVARLAPQKGVEHFIRAAALVKKKYRSAKFIIVGDGPFRYWLETMAQQYGVKDCTEFTGFRSDALSIVAGFDVFALTSMRETFGMALVEAMSLGVPAVASNVGGIPEIVDGSSTGLLAEPGNAEDIAKKICLLLKDKDLAAEIGRAGCESVRSRFGSDRMLDDVQRTYGEMVDG
ncbi:MAG: glycosyltransferase family 4 protein [Armatimonadetes bacterium]|nr:glycosyltransferase family 4 protein [Armatimonadota bacterium]